MSLDKREEARRGTGRTRTTNFRMNTKRQIDCTAMKIDRSMEKQHWHKPANQFLKGVALVLAIFLVSGCEPVFADTTRFMNNSDILNVYAIIGEAANQPFRGQIAVACGIKNRPEGLQGVEGAYISRSISRLEWQSAVDAYSLSLVPEVCFEITQGADMWCSDLDVCAKSWLGVPMIYITTIGDHHFFRRLTGK